MSKCLTPNDIDVLMHSYCGCGPHERIDAGAVSESTANFLMYGIIVGTGKKDEYRTTPLGDAYVRAICSTPPPQCKFVCGLTGEVLDG